MKIISAEIIACCVGAKGYPDAGLPEIAFLGRSNVGKSSLINALCNKKGLAKKSSTPGKTRTLNFYLVNNALIFVDLPGYGYARASMGEIKKMGVMADNYLKKRQTLKGAVLLIDARRRPLESDELMFDYLTRANIKTAVALTKTDKLNKGELLRNSAQIKAALNAAPERFYLTSSAAKTGVIELWEGILSLAQQKAPGGER